MDGHETFGRWPASPSMMTAYVPPRPQLAVDHTGNGPLVLLMHGVGGNRSNWSDQLPAFGENFTAVAWDARGYGSSEDFLGDFAFSDFADDVPRVLDFFEARQAHLVGLSMGGHIALDAADRYGDHVASLTLCDTNAGFAHLTAQQKIKFVELRTKRLRQGGEPLDIAEDVAKALCGRAATPVTFQRLVDSMAALHNRSYIEIVEAMVKADFSTSLGLISVPTHIVVGEDDRLTPPAVAHQLQRSIPGSELTIIPRAGHLSNIECPDLFNSAALRFLAKHR